MDKVNLKGEKRKVTGRKVKRLREEGILPGNVYGKKFKSESIQVDLKDFKKVFEEAGETGLVEIAVNGDKYLTLIKNIQTNPVTEEFIHVDFHRISLKEKVSAMIPLELAGEAPAEKQGLGTVVQYIDEIEVEALPTDLPDKFELDVSTLKEVDQQFTIADLEVDKKKVEIQNDADQILVRVEEMSEEEIEEPVVSEEVEGEAPEEGGQTSDAQEGQDLPKEEDDKAPEENK